MPKPGVVRPITQRGSRPPLAVSTPGAPKVRRISPCFPLRFRLCDVPHILRQIVSNLMPGGPGTDENMGLGPDRGRVDQRAHRDMDPGALAYDRPEQRTAAPAVHIMRR